MPTVVIEAGASSFAIDFALVQPEVAKATRVCSYNRAGSGWSNERPDVETPIRVVRELRALLDAAGEKGPFVLVGASRGGLYVHFSSPIPRRRRRVGARRSGGRKTGCSRCTKGSRFRSWR